MADNLSADKRSWLMSRIPPKNSTPEIIVRKHLYRNGFRFLLHYKKLPGTPDIVLRKYKTVIFVNGCFWHKHEGCTKSRTPKTRPAWWSIKASTTSLNDKVNYINLKKLGWSVLVIWQCDLGPAHKEAKLNEIILALRNKENLGYNKHIV